MLKLLYQQVHIQRVQRLILVLSWLLLGTEELVICKATHSNACSEETARQVLSHQNSGGQEPTRKKHLALSCTSAGTGVVPARTLVNFPECTFKIRTPHSL
jgi:hypothetical protein